MILAFLLVQTCLLPHYLILIIKGEKMERHIILGKEALFFALAVVASLVFWIFLAIITEQNIIAREYLYVREKYAFLATVGFIYFIRLNAWVTNES